jgi:hypothetical protein
MDDNYTLAGCCPNENLFQAIIETFFAHKSWRSERKAISTV